MKRLRKKAWAKMELYHATSIQYFIKMMNEGQILPGGYTGNISGGGHDETWDLASESDGNNSQYSIRTMDAYSVSMYVEKPVNKITFTQDLINKVQEMQQQYTTAEMINQKIKLRIENPSGNEIGVYLGKSQRDAEYYLRDSLNGTDSSLPNAPIVLKINVDEDALSPDLDDGNYNSNVKIQPWKQTLDTTGQCVHNGPIPASDITSVYIYLNKMKAEKFNSYNLMERWAEDYVTFEEWIDPITAMSQINEMNQAYQMLPNIINSEDDLQQVSLTASRLKKTIK